MSDRERLLLLVAGAAVLLLALVLVVLDPYLEESELLAKQTQAATNEWDAGQLVLVREQSIRGGWAAHRAHAPAEGVEALAAAFQEDLVKLFRDVGIKGKGFEKRREAKHGEFVEVILSTGFEGTNEDLVNLMKALDEYPGYLRANVVQVNTPKGKQDEKLDVKLEVSTIWFSAGNGGRS